MNKLLLCGMAAACMINGAAWGDEMHGSREPEKKMMMMKMGGHAMTGKVESVDHKTGWVKVMTNEGALTVHFPPDSVKDLKDGEMITVHLSYTKGEKKGGAMMEQKMEKPMQDGGMMK